MSEHENWKSWWEAHKPDTRKRVKTIPRDRSYSEEAWREFFGGAPDEHAEMINQDYPEEDYARYMVPFTAENGKRGVYFGISDLQDGRIIKGFELVEGLDTVGIKGFYPDCGYSYEYKKDVNYINPLSNRESKVDEIQIKVWEVDDDLNFKSLNEVELLFAPYIRWEKKRWAFHSTYQEGRLYEPMQRRLYASRDASYWRERQRNISYMTDFYNYVRNEDGEMVLNAPPFAEKLHSLPENLGKADIVSFPAKE